MILSTKELENIFKHITEKDHVIPHKYQYELWLAHGKPKSIFYRGGQWGGHYKIGALAYFRVKKTSKWIMERYRSMHDN